MQGCPRKLDLTFLAMATSMQTQMTTARQAVRLSSQGNTRSSVSAFAPKQAQSQKRQQRLSVKAAANNESRYGACWPGRVEVPLDIPKLGNGVVKKISLLGSTGSIGTQTLDIVEEHPDKFQVVALSAGRNIELIAEQVMLPAII
eukprot:9190782-Pyramimonas_sp.AAC.1